MQVGGFKRGGGVPNVEALNAMNDYMKRAYERALADGLSMVVYDGAVSADV